ncbi:MAG TPA: exosome complex RNA-binding protein Rrp4 [Candidatus Thermoplasmatota archaeon]|nr:exosome complex RNA-binding protein Rrp4 [Candidatus Thermoplasmatota archaeon]
MDEQESRTLVVPGDVLDDSGRFKPGPNTYKEAGRVYAARLGLRLVRGDTIGVISLSGRYDPQRNDMVVATVVEAGPSNWYLNVGAPTDVGMHVNDVPWRVEFGETTKYLAPGDTVLVKILNVDPLKKAVATMKDRQCRKLQGGTTVEIAPTKVPRVIGKNGSMISQIKTATATRTFVGQNGVIWIDGEAPDVAMAIAALRMIEENAHTSGLTDRVRAFLADYKPAGTPVTEEEFPPEDRFERRGPPRDRDRPRGDFGRREGSRDRRGEGGRRGDFGRRRDDEPRRRREWGPEAGEVRREPRPPRERDEAPSMREDDADSGAEPPARGEGAPRRRRRGRRGGRGRGRGSGSDEE